MTPEQRRIVEALQVAQDCGQTDRAHHKMWVIDQMVRELTGCPMVSKDAVDHQGIAYTYQTLGESEEYRAWIAAHNEGEDGPNTYSWDEGIAP